MQFWELLSDQAFWLGSAILVVVTLGSYLALTVALRALSRQFQRRNESSSSRLYHYAAELLRYTNKTLVFAFALMLGLKTIILPPRWESAMEHGWFIILSFQLALWLDHACKLWTESLTRDGKTRNPVTTTLIGIMLRMIVWIIMLLSVLSNLGVDVTAMIASLGVGGIAIALAVQTLLSDIFASLSIGIDKPFEIGDFVVFGEVAGNIEHIGLKTTRIRALSGEQIVCANADLLAQTLHNYKRMATRRIVFQFAISSQTPVDKTRNVSAEVQRIIENIDNTKFDRAHLLSFDENQLNFEVVYIMQVSDYNAYMDVQQRINLELLDTLSQMHISFAFPNRRVIFSGNHFPEISVAARHPHEASINDLNSSNPQVEA